MTLLLFITVLLLPAYAVRFEWFGMPLNLLLVWTVFVWLVFFCYLLLARQFREFFKSVVSIQRLILVPAILFFVAGLISLTIAKFSIESTGLFLVWFVQPLILFLIGRFIVNKKPESREVIIQALYLLLAVLGFIAIFQFTSLQFLPETYWGNTGEPKRAIGLFSHPNFLALFVAPLLGFLLPKVSESISRLGRSKDFSDIGPVLSWLLGAAALFLSLSRAGWLGLAVAVALFVIVAGDKKIRLAVLGLALVAVAFVSFNTNLRYRLVLPFVGEKSAVSRLSLWDTGVKAVQESPLVGLGLGGFGNNWNRLNTDPNIDTHNFPHNVFLNFWVETGLLGLISFLILAGYSIVRGFKKRSNAYALGLALFMIALIVQGILDNPYFKNDLAMLFWLVVALGQS